MKAVLKGISQGLMTIALSFAIALVTLFGINHIQDMKALALSNTFVDGRLAQVNYTRTDLDNQNSIEDKTSSKHLIDNSRANLKENTEDVRDNVDKLKSPEAETFVEDIQQKLSNIFGREEEPTQNRSYLRAD